MFDSKLHRGGQKENKEQEVIMSGIPVCPGLTKTRRQEEEEEEVFQQEEGQAVWFHQQASIYSSKHQHTNTTDLMKVDTKN